MGKLLNAPEICTRALRLIGAFPVSESAPEGEHLQESLLWLDLILEEVNGTSIVASFMPQTVRMNLLPGVQEYVLSFSDMTMQFPEQAFLEDEAGNRTDLTIVDRSSFESVSRLDRAGPPRWIHIDRTTQPRLLTFPTIPATDLRPFRIALVVQAAPPDVTPKGVANATPTNAAHGFRAAWQRFLIYRLAADIGSGPVATLPGGRITAFRKEAELAYFLLDRFDREHDNEDPIASAYEPGYDDLRYYRDYDRRGR